MKTKTSFFSLISSIIILSFIFSSCTTTNNVVSSGPIQKRKYNKGFFVNIFPKREKVSTVLHPNSETAVMTENSLSSLSLKGGEFSDANPSRSGQKHQKIDTTNIYLLASVDNVKQIDNNATKPVPPEDKNIKQKLNTGLVGKIISKIERKVNTPFPLKRDDEKPRLNGMALAGFICSLLGPTIGIGLSFIGAISSPTAIITAIILGIIALMCIIFGIIYSSLALRRMRRNPGKWKGRGFAIAGLIIGFLTVLVIFAALIYGFYYLMTLN
jgi:hypothetical protein